MVSCAPAFPCGSQESANPEEALPRLLRAIDLYERTLGARHAYVGIGHHNLGLVRLALGQVEPARRSLEIAVSVCLYALGSLHSDTRGAVTSLRSLLDELGAPAEECASLRDAEEQTRTDAVVMIRARWRSYQRHRVKHHALGIVPPQMSSRYRASISATKSFSRSFSKGPRMLSFTKGLSFSRVRESGSAGEMADQVLATPPPPPPRSTRWAVHSGKMADANMAAGEAGNTVAEETVNIASDRRMLVNPLLLRGQSQDSADDTEYAEAAAAAAVAASAMRKAGSAASAAAAASAVWCSISEAKQAASSSQGTVSSEQTDPWRVFVTNLNKGAGHFMADVDQGISEWLGGGRELPSQSALASPPMLKSDVSDKNVGGYAGASAQAVRGGPFITPYASRPDMDEEVVAAAAAAKMAASALVLAPTARCGAALATTAVLLARCSPAPPTTEVKNASDMIIEISPPEQALLAHGWSETEHLTTKHGSTAGTWHAAAHACGEHLPATAVVLKQVSSAPAAASDGIDAPYQAMSAAPQPGRIRSDRMRLFRESGRDEKPPAAQQYITPLTVCGSHDSDIATQTMAPGALITERIRAFRAVASASEPQGNAGKLPAARRSHAFSMTRSTGGGVERALVLSKELPNDIAGDNTRMPAQPQQTSFGKSPQCSKTPSYAKSASYTRTHSYSRSQAHNRRAGSSRFHEASTSNLPGIAEMATSEIATAELLLQQGTKHLQAGRACMAEVLLRRAFVACDAVISAYNASSGCGDEPSTVRCHSSSGANIGCPDSGPITAPGAPSAAAAVGMAHARCVIIWPMVSTALAEALLTQHQIHGVHGPMPKALSKLCGAELLLWRCFEYAAGAPGVGLAKRRKLFAEHKERLAVLQRAQRGTAAKMLQRCYVARSRPPVENLHTAAAASSLHPGPDMNTRHAFAQEVESNVDTTSYVESEADIDVNVAPALPHIQVASDLAMQSFVMALQWRPRANSALDRNGIVTASPKAKEFNEEGDAVEKTVYAANGESWDESSCDDDESVERPFAALIRRGSFQRLQKGLHHILNLLPPPDARGYLLQARGLLATDGNGSRSQVQYCNSDVKTISADVSPTSTLPVTLLSPAEKSLQWRPDESLQMRARTMANPTRKIEGGEMRSKTFKHSELWQVPAVQAALPATLTHTGQWRPSADVEAQARRAAARKAVLMLEGENSAVSERLDNVFLGVTSSLHKYRALGLHDFGGGSQLLPDLLRERADGAAGQVYVKKGAHRASGGRTGGAKANDGPSGLSSAVRIHANRSAPGSNGRASGPVAFGRKGVIAGSVSALLSRSRATRRALREVDGDRESVQRKAQREKRRAQRRALRDVLEVDAESVKTAGKGLVNEVQFSNEVIARDGMTVSEVTGEGLLRPPPAPPARPKMPEYRLKNCQRNPQTQAEMVDWTVSCTCDACTQKSQIRWLQLSLCDSADEDSDTADETAPLVLAVDGVAYQGADTATNELLVGKADALSKDAHEAGHDEHGHESAPASTPRRAASSRFRRFSTGMLRVVRVVSRSSHRQSLPASASVTQPAIEQSVDGGCTNRAQSWSRSQKPSLRLSLSNFVRLRAA